VSSFCIRSCSGPPRGFRAGAARFVLGGDGYVHLEHLLRITKRKVKHRTELLAPLDGWVPEWKPNCRGKHEVIDLRQAEAEGRLW